MSAYVVNRKHIQYLVTAAKSLRDNGSDGFSWYHEGEWKKLPLFGRDRASDIGQMLWDENIKSIEHRYPDCVGNHDRMPGPIDETFIYAHSSDWKGAIDPVQVIKSARCYQYQTSEHDGWETSEAYAFIKALINRAIYKLPGYEDAEWGEPVEAKAVAI